MGFRPRQLLGKYRIQSRVGTGGFADVYRATDTIEGVDVALKIPHAQHVSSSLLDSFKAEVRLIAKLDHPNVLPLKNASFIDEHFVIASPLGERTLADRIQRRVGLRSALGYFEQLVEALAYAHDQGIIHCDVKPENLILFADDRLRLADFGIAKVALKTVQASGSGTVGYMAPEQAMGRPSPRSDVFSAGLILWRMLTGQLPEWPFDWPLKGYERLRKGVHPDLVKLMRRATEVDQRKRHADARQLLVAYKKVRTRVLSFDARGPARERTITGSAADWRAVRLKQFLREHGRALDTRHRCAECDGPVSEAMRACPWCGAERERHDGETKMPCRCDRCQRGVKADWRYCAWCYGPSIGPASARKYTDKRYTARCRNSECPRKQLMPLSRYCPWCRTKVDRRWTLETTKDRCGRCGQGVVGDYWEHCPWCAASLRPTRPSTSRSGRSG
jgi:serine/threonine protein kinase